MRPLAPIEKAALANTLSQIWRNRSRTTATLIVLAGSPPATPPLAMHCSISRRAPSYAVQDTAPQPDQGLAAEAMARSKPNTDNVIHNTLRLIRGAVCRADKNKPSARPREQAEKPFNRIPRNSRDTVQWANSLRSSLFAMDRPGHLSERQHSRLGLRRPILRSRGGSKRRQRQTN
jgi:hypothetical protein